MKTFLIIAAAVYVVGVLFLIYDSIKHKSSAYPMSKKVYLGVIVFWPIHIAIILWIVGVYYFGALYHSKFKKNKAIK